MKRIAKSFMSVSLIFAIVMLAACGGGSSTTSNEQSDSNGKKSSGNITLRASSGISAEHFWHVGYFGPFMEQIEKDSNGEVSFEAFTSGELVQLGTEYDALRQGSIDVALTLMAAYDPQRFPYTEVTMLPLLESDANIAATAVQNMMRSDRIIADGKTYYQLEFDDKGLVAFATPPTEPYVISTTKVKFESINDFNESIRLRSPSRVHEILAKNLKLTPISMPITDAYDALSRNALDGMFYNIPDWISMGLDELIQHTIVGANLGHYVGYTALTKEKWETLPEDARQNMQKLSDELIFNGAKVAMDDAVVNIDNNIEKGGELTHLDELDPEVREHINQAIVKTWFDWIESLEAQQHAGKEIAMLWRDELVKAGAKLPQEIMDLK